MCVASNAVKLLCQNKCPGLRNHYASINPRICSSVLDVASLETALDSFNEWRWNSTLELRKVACVNLGWETKSSIDNGRVEGKEVLCNAARSWVF